MPVVTIALVTAIVSGSLSAAAVANLLRPGSSGATNEATGSSVSQVHIDESSATRAGSQQVRHGRGREGAETMAVTSAMVTTGTTPRLRRGCG